MLIYIKLGMKSSMTIDVGGIFIVGQYIFIPLGCQNDQHNPQKQCVQESNGIYAGAYGMKKEG